ncbi:MAG: hypothetical protein ACQUHE_01790 [Bacteroidia bacterium]
MIWKIIGLFCVSLVVVVNVLGQVKGVVYDQVSRVPLAHVELTNVSSQAQTMSNDKGEFTLNGKVNDLLVFRRPGYRSDTLLITNSAPVLRYMSVDKTMLKTVVISDTRTLRKQYAQTFNEANPFLLQQGRGLLLYPSGFFSRERKQARYFVRMLKSEKKERIIDRVYNLKSITAILPIPQPELDAFVVRYRPDLKFAQRISPEDFKSYIMDCYWKFKLLPPAERILPVLK